MSKGGMVFVWITGIICYIVVLHEIVVAGGAVLLAILSQIVLIFILLMNLLFPKRKN